MSSPSTPRLDIWQVSEAVIDRPSQDRDYTPVRYGLGAGVAMAGVGGALIGLSAGGGRGVGFVLLVAGVIICLGTLLEGARRAENRKWLRRRKPFWIDKPDGSKQKVTYGYVLRLSPADRRALLAGHQQMQAWFQSEWGIEALALTVETVAANPLRRLWLWLVLPRRFREPWADRHQPEQARAPDDRPADTPQTSHVTPSEATRGARTAPGET